MQHSSGADKILVVDDEAKIRTILAAVLQDDGYDVETAGDGIEAVVRAAEFGPHVMIVDLQMPRMDGLETILRIKQHLPQAVAIILTAHGTIQSAVQAIKQGVYDYLTKPFDNEQMLLVVKRALDVYRLNEEVAQLKSELGKNIASTPSLAKARSCSKCAARFDRSRRLMPPCSSKAKAAPARN